MKGPAKARPRRLRVPLELHCGVDEAGRGPLAGPVYAAAVILDRSRPIRGLRDSKKLSAEQREDLVPLIRERALAWSVAWAEVGEIDTLNILRATLLAMRRAVDGLNPQPELARVDGNQAPPLTCRIETVIGGDDLDASISAASILAKTARDAWMVQVHERWPQFGFHLHKGYSTPLHLEMLKLHGPTEIHRRSFAPVRMALERQLFDDLPGVLAEDSTTFGDCIEED